MGKNDVICYLRGGLGNQLFQYAAAFAVAQRSGGQVKIYKEAVDLHHGPYCLNKIIKNYQETDQVIHYNKWQRLLCKVHLNKKMYIERSKAYETAFATVLPPIQLYGFFLSYHYFKPCEEKLRKQFKWPIQSSSIHTMHKAIINAPISVGVHVRRGDILDPKIQKLCGISPLPISYYRKSIELLQSTLKGSVNFFIFTNDATYVQKNFDFCPSKTVLDPQSHEPYEALFLMSQCDHMILSNSTFSWWGGWLNSNKDPKIIAPKVWYNQYSFGTHPSSHLNDLILDSWICM